MSLFSTFLLTLFVFTTGCNSEPETIQTVPERAGDRGESCQARNDCKSGLACVRGTCVRTDYAIEPAGGQCTLVECTATEDCCSSLGSYCQDLQDDCNNGDDFACDEFEDACACDYECSDNQCRRIADACEGDGDCFGGVCENGRCLQCRSAGDCDSDEVCVQGFCEEGCQTDSNCPLFQQCEGGECVESGCQSDRECVLFSEDGDAVCRDGECLIPCTNDAECNEGGDSFFEVCERGRCVFVGCETDRECRIALDLENTSGSQEAICETGQ